MDERFLMHRLRATRWAAIVGVMLMAAWTTYEFCVHRLLRWDMLIVMVAMGLAKWSTMLYYRKAD